MLCGDFFYPILCLNDGIEQNIMILPTIPYHKNLCSYDKGFFFYKKLCYSNLRKPVLIGLQVTLRAGGALCANQ